MKRPAPVWLAFSGALAVVLAVMVFFTVRMLQFERSEAAAQAHAALEETIRLALWRMDSAAALMLDTPSGAAINLSNTATPLPTQQQVNDRFDQQFQGKISQQEYQQRGNLSQSSNRRTIPNWRSIEPALLERIKDILPGASLEPATDTNPDDTRRLASIPARLVVPGSATPDAGLPWHTPLRISLMVAWLGVLLAAAAVAYLLIATLALSQRRANFASAVTHELRTPLTTFRMYAEMLSSGMVNDPEKRTHYLTTLVTESDRLGHLIENVLAYSRLENRLSQRHAEPITVSQLLDHALPTLRRRVEQAGLTLDVQLPPDVATAICRTDPVTVQQILLNLIDNACKYGRTPISLAATIHADHFELTVSDQGPGIPHEGGAKLFTAFGKSKSDPIPGIGLGLYLSRQLARDLHGDLVHHPGPAGAAFTLTIPR